MNALYCSKNPDFVNGLFRICRIFVDVATKRAPRRIRGALFYSKLPVMASAAAIERGPPQSLAKVNWSTSCFRLAASADSSSLAAALSWAVALLVWTTEEI